MLSIQIIVHIFTHRNTANFSRSGIAATAAVSNFLKKRATVDDPNGSMVDTAEIDPLLSALKENGATHRDSCWIWFPPLGKGAQFTLSYNLYYQLSIINCQLSTVNYQLSIINCQLSTVNYQLSIPKSQFKNMSEIIVCPTCSGENCYNDGTMNICPECSAEWNADQEAAPSTTPRDSNGTDLVDGDAVTVIKDLKVKGSSMVVKRGTRVKSIRLTQNPEEVDCKVEGTSIVLKTCFLKK